MSLFTCIYIQSSSIFSSVKINTNDISNLIHDINKPVYVLTGVEWLTYPHLTVTVSLLKCFYRKEHQFFLPLEDSFALQIVIEDLQLSIDKAEEGTCTIVRKMANFANEHGTPITL